MSEAVFCIVPNEQQASHIVDSLRLAGFNSTDISILLPDKNVARDLGHEKHSKAPEGVSTGASTGALLGGALGWLTGIGALAIPGLGPFIAAGPIMSMLGGAAIGGTVGGVTGGLIGLELPEYEAKQYEGKLHDGNILLSLHTTNASHAKKAEDLFRALGAKDITRAEEAKVAKGVKV
jgi:hypothetical protein